MSKSKSKKETKKVIGKTKIDLSSVNLKSDPKLKPSKKITTEKSSNKLAKKSTQKNNSSVNTGIEQKNKNKRVVSAKKVKPISKSSFKLIWNIFEQFRVATICRTSDGKMLGMNEEAKKLTGYSKDEIPDTKTWLSRLYPDLPNREIIEKTIRESFLQSDNEWHLEVSITTKSGEKKELLALYNNISYEGKSAKIQIVQFLDITARKKVEEENLQQKFLIEQLLLNVPDKIYFKDLQSRFLSISNSFYDTLHISLKNEIIGKTDFDVYDFEHASDAFSDEQRIIKTGRPIVGKEEKEVWSDGTVHWVSATKMPYKDAKGSIIGTFGISRDITEIIKARNLLKESEERYRKLVDYSPFAILVHHNGRIVFTNRACVTMAHAKSEIDLINKDIFEFMPREFVSLPEGIEKTSPFELKFHCLDGQIIDVEATSIPIMFNDNNSILVFANDITERKRVQKELEESEERYKSIFEYAPYALMLQQEDKLIYVNSASVELLMAESSEELLGKNIFDFVHNDYKLALKNNIDESNSSHKPSNAIEEKLVCLNGAMIDVEMLPVPFMLHGVYSTLFMIQFIGEIKAKNNELRKLSSAVSQSSAGIMITDKHGIIEYVNPKFTEISGYSEEEALGQTTRLLNSGEQPQEYYHQLWDTILKGNEWRGEFRNKKKSGELYWEFDSISAIKNERGDITHFLSVKEDITERKKIEGDILLAKDEAEEANKVKSSLLANMSHEFRTPLNGILGFAQLLKDSVIEDDVLMMTEKIEKSGKRLMNTLNAVLSLTELETEDFVVQENEIELAFFCKGIASHFERIANDKELQLILDIQVPTLLTVSDEGLLTKIVSSICDNAIKYTLQGKVTIQLPPPINKNNQDYAVINVIDTGMGIRKENHDLIFKEFRQLSEGIRRDFEGLGLGLTLANRMARLIDAEISVESEFGMGSKFSVMVPITTKDHPIVKDESTVGSQLVSNPEQQNQNTLKILLVEDNPLNVEVVQRFLSKFGNVKSSRDGKGALKLASEEQFDLLLIDINLGAGIDGIEVLRLLRMQDNYNNTPAVALTGYASDTNKREFLAKGFTGYLAKPFEKKVLINLLKELV